MGTWKRFARLMWGLVVSAGGIYCEIQAGIGLAPWDAFGMGIAGKTGMLFGDAVFLIGVVVIVLDLLLREKVGIGTVLNATLVGKFVDVMDWAHLLPPMQGFWPGLGLLLVGQVLVCIGSYFYIGAGWGAGPRDSLMVCLSRKVPKIPIGLARFCVECTVLLIGWAMGAPVGIGSVITMCGISFLMQGIFHLLHFVPKSIRHEGLTETVMGLLHRSTAKRI